jgi:hypothetical protein
LLYESIGFRAGLDAGAAHAHIQVEVHVERDTPGFALLINGCRDSRCIYECTEACRRKIPGKLQQTRDFGAGRLIGEQDVFGTAAGEHFCLCYGGAFEFSDAHFQL